MPRPMEEITISQRAESREQRAESREQRAEKPFNNKMNILKALGIMAVVGGHCGINFLSWFPVYSFHMPLFIFISGYFFHDVKFLSFLKSKWTHLVRPFLAWNLVFGILCMVFWHYGLIRFGQPLSWKTLLVDPFTHGHQFVFNCPTWFVGTLVEVQILYWFLYRICRRKHIFLAAVCLICYGVSYIMADHQWQKMYGDFMLAAEKSLFLLIFYELGSLYRLYGEKKDSFSVNRMAGLVIFNGILLGFVNHHIGYGVVFMNMPDRIWMPLVTALTGIYLYLQAAELLKDKVKRNSLLGFIGEHTFSIMTLHLFFFWLLNTAFWQLKEYGVFPLRSFHYDQYMHNIYFQITEHAPMVNGIYFLAGMGGSLLCVYLYERCKPALCQYIRAWRA